MKNGVELRGNPVGPARASRFPRTVSIVGLLAALGSLSVSMLYVSTKEGTEVVNVMATVETAPVPTAGDAADDAAVWVHPTDPSQSVVIGTDKDRGLAVYDLSGRQIQFLPDGQLNNVDLRYDFPLGGKRVALVTAGDRLDNSIAIYRLNERTRMLEDVAARKFTTLPAYGSCMYQSRLTGKTYYFIDSHAGDVEQWELSDNGFGKVEARRVRSFSTGFRTEGCVADDELGHLYIGLEDEGVWKYGAEPETGGSSTVVDRRGPGRHLAANDIEGLALYRNEGGTGYLIVSNQGRDNFVTYRREGDNAYVGTFRIVEGNGIDAVTHTDGIVAQSRNLGPAFPRGVFVAQDDENDAGNQNFKLVPWESIEAALRRAPNR